MGPRSTSRLGEWSETLLKDVAVVNEVTIDKKYPNDVIEYIDIASVEQGRIVTQQVLKLSNAPSRAKRIVRDKDILISTVRPNLKHYCFVNRAQSNTVASTGFAVVTARNADPYFLYCLLTTDNYTEYLTRIAEGHTSAYPSFNPDVIENSVFLMPTLPEQTAIAEVLSSLDDKIESLRKQNETLEKIAQTLFQEWFVEFNFPDKNGEPYKASGCKMVDSELGPIPQGWIVAPIGNHVRCVGGSTPSTSEPAYWNDGSVAFLTPRDMSSLSSPVILGTERYITGSGVEQISSGILPKGTVVLSSRAPIGYLAITALPLVINQGIIGMICDSILPSSFVFDWVKLNLGRIKANAGGSTFAEINKSSFRAIKAVIPARDILSEYSSVTSEVIQKVLVNGHHCTTLSQLRDLLLPKLMNGEIRLKDLL